MAEAAPLVELWRGALLESRHRGHAVVADARGAVVAAWGDPGATIYPRSSCKMLQALPLLESGAGAGLSSERMALACASHEGAAIHVTRVAAWLAEMGLGEPDLRCGPQIPSDADERRRLREAGLGTDQLHNNCSGKHAGFLMLGRHLGGGAEYVEIDHPVQKAVRAAFEEMTGAESPGWGVDGCSAPNFACSVTGLATAMARMADPSGLGRARGDAARALVEAMCAHPDLVAGEGRACTELTRAARGAVAVKTGAEGVFTAILPARGLGVAVKIEDGATRAAECAIAALLVRLGAVSAEDPATLRRLSPPIHSRRGFPAGATRPDPGFFAEGRAI
ncbi:asparaginase [Amaricoccus sp.]|uniref:asparaginase n=1 Tax=Amaricoccus sp. TaxID=1872485 RepID=UPI001B6ECFFE|nr:asparaginase [Amaricoccus sp.]MBP7240427.1 asparaginase [Amaricoccus sp.]